MLCCAAMAARRRRGAGGRDSRSIATHRPTIIQTTMITLLTSALAFTSPSILQTRARIFMAAPSSFEKALDDAPTLCKSLQQGETPDGLASFLSTSAGARGFFVCYLTDEDYTVADQSEVPQPLVEGLAAASAETVEVMLMNIVMSSATGLFHERAGREDHAASSARRARRILSRRCGTTAGAAQSFGALSAAVETEFLVEAPPQPVRWTNGCDSWRGGSMIRINSR